MDSDHIETLIIIPTKMEFDAFIKEYISRGFTKKAVSLGSLILHDFEEIRTGIALGGLGKTQFAVQTQFCINKINGLKQVLCIGAAGRIKIRIEIWRRCNWGRNH